MRRLSSISLLLLVATLSLFSIGSALGTADRDDSSGESRLSFLRRGSSYASSITSSTTTTKSSTAFELTMDVPSVAGYTRRVRVLENEMHAANGDDRSDANIVEGIADEVSVINEYSGLDSQYNNEVRSRNIQGRELGMVRRRWGRNKRRQWRRRWRQNWLKRNKAPSSSKSALATNPPTIRPTRAPTATGSAAPSSLPSSRPTVMESSQPSTTPSERPSQSPTVTRA